jgi:hypothetical protein
VSRIRSVIYLTPVSLEEAYDLWAELQVHLFVREGDFLMPGVKEIIDFINGLDSKAPPAHDRVMRRTYALKPGEVTFALFWKDPHFSDGSTAPYIAFDFHYKIGKSGQGYLGGIWVKGVKDLSLKPEQMDDLGIPIAKYLAAVNLSDPPPKPDELQDFDKTFYHVNENLDAYQDNPGHQRRR